MERTVQVFEKKTYDLPHKKRVAAYARVSLGTEHMLHSLAAQVSYYSNMIQKNPEWEFAGIFADKAQTGTKDSRPEFQRLMNDCRNGLIDMVIVKSISRLARNTVTLLNTVRELKELGIDIFFEEQNIHTMSETGEMMLSLFAVFAQEESKNISDNIKWRKRNDMKNGKTKPKAIYGYDVVDGILVINEEQAEVIREMYRLYGNSVTYGNFKVERFRCKSFNGQRENERKCSSPSAIYRGLSYKETEMESWRTADVPTN